MEMRSTPYRRQRGGKLIFFLIRQVGQDHAVDADQVERKRSAPYLNNRSNHFEIHLELKNSNYLRDFVTVSRQLGLRIDDIEANQAYVGSGLSVYTITFTIFSAELKKYKTHREIIRALSSLDYIYHIEELR